MKSTLLWSLAGLNLLLAAILVAKITPDNQAMAQRALPGDYLMIPGQAVGLSYSVVYVVDQTNQQLSAMAWNQGKMEMIPAIDLKRVFGDDAGGGQNPPRGRTR
jgi:hypothetical protein